MLTTLCTVTTLSSRVNPWSAPNVGHPSAAAVDSSSASATLKDPAMLPLSPAPGGMRSPATLRR